MLAGVALLATWAAGALPEVALARVATHEPVVALTFDACATQVQPNGFDRAVFEILKRERVPATVFVSGRWIEFHPDEARALAAEPLLDLGNHTYSHPMLTRLKPDDLAREIARTDELIEGLGRKPVALRPPGGVWDRRVLRAAGERHLPVVLWDVLSGDAGGHVPAKTMIATVARAVRPGSIVIFHINERAPYTKDALPEILRVLHGRGFRFVRLGELLALPDARAVAAPPQPIPRRYRSHAAKAG
jgi:peptidoglycan/xylan/chitin deacetylase (PgdA/CDA1 family)